MSGCARGAVVTIRGNVLSTRDPEFSQLPPQQQAMIVAGNILGGFIDSADTDEGETRSYMLSCRAAGCAAAFTLSADETGRILIDEDVPGCELEMCTEIPEE